MRNISADNTKTFVRPEIAITPGMNAENKLLLSKNVEDAAIAKLPQIRERVQKIANEKMTIKNK